MENSTTFIFIKSMDMLFLIFGQSSIFKGQINLALQFHYIAQYVKIFVCEVLEKLIKSS